MAKTTDKDLDKLTNIVNDFMKEFKTSVSKELKPMGENLLREIQERTIKGDGVTDKGKIKKFKKLKKSTIASRHSMNKAGKLNSNTSPEMSNQIATGRMVLDAKVKVDKQKLNIEISPPDDRVDVQEYQEDMGRMAFNIDKEQQDYIEDTISKIADKAIKKVLK